MVWVEVMAVAFPLAVVGPKLRLFCGRELLPAAVWLACG